MADFSRVSANGWEQGNDTSDASRVTANGWYQIIAPAATPSTRGVPFGSRGTAFNGGRPFVGPITN